MSTKNDDIKKINKKIEPMVSFIVFQFLRVQKQIRKYME